MVKIDLITGFLGSGKTTFIKKYVKYWLDKGQKIGILENDYGAVNVDMVLASELMGENCNIEMVAGGCDYDCHKRRFKTKLISMGMSGYSRVIVEPSGIYDVDEFFDTLYEEPLDNWYEIGNVIAIVDAGLRDDLSPESEYLLASQIADAGKIVFSKTQNTDAESLNNTVIHLNNCLEKFSCNRRFFLEEMTDKAENKIRKSDIIFAKSWDEMTAADMYMLANCEYRRSDHVKMPVNDNNSYDSLYYMNTKITRTRDQVLQMIDNIMSDADCGDVYRIKGFIAQKKNGEELTDFLEINATREELSINPIEKGSDIFVVIGEKMDKNKIDAYIY